MGEGLSPVEKSALAGLCQNSIHPVALSTFRELENSGPISIDNRVEHLHWGLSGCFINEGKEVEIHFGRVLQNENDFPEGLDLERVPEAAYEMQNALWIDKKFRAALSYTDEVRPGVSQSLAELLDKGIKVQLLSGDRQDRVDQFLKTAPDDVEGLGDLTPQGKLEHLQNYQKKETVLAVGDGLNDSLLLNHADLGMLAEGGFRALSTGVDILAIKPDWKGFGRLFDLANRSKRSIRLSYITSLIYNGLALYFAFVGHLAPLIAAIAMPISSLSVCLVVALNFMGSDSRFPPSRE